MRNGNEITTNDIYKKHTQINATLYGDYEKKN
jgi:hypothetical protein